MILPPLALRLYEPGRLIASESRTTTVVAKSTLRAFNDVTEIPDDGVWFQVFHKNGTIEINEGENGLVRLDNIVQAAKDNNLHVVFSLTNNWYRGASSGKDNHKTEEQGDYTDTPVDRRFRRNFLSNNYG
jgi:mannan endo-1,4-beta-mannosidase